ncbi:MAG: rod shape-determining protein [Clostridia bacterium]|nr:rod shape-determining protein [Clostridia bacterium]
MNFFSKDIAIDLGTATILVYVEDKGIVLREPSVVAVNKYTEEILAVGEEASKMLGRTPGSIVAIRPLKDGVISNYTITKYMLKYFIDKVSGKYIFSPRVMICVPSKITEVEKKAVLDAAKEAGAKKVHLIEEPLAAAIGAGIDITKAYGTMIVDIGGGTTDIAVISLGGSVKSTTLKVAGDKFDESIMKYIKKNRGVIIGEKTAEEIKIKIGSAYPRRSLQKVKVKGRDLANGLPVQIVVSSEEVYYAISPCTEEILEGVCNILECTPPELLTDISSRGIYLTGGGSLLSGLDTLIQEKTKLPVLVAEDPVSCVAIGSGKALSHVQMLESGNGVKIKKL